MFKIAAFMPQGLNQYQYTCSSDITVLFILGLKGKDIVRIEVDESVVTGYDWVKEDGILTITANNKQSIFILYE